MSRSTHRARLEALEARCGGTSTLADALKAIAAEEKAEREGADVETLEGLSAEVERAVSSLPADVVAELGRIAVDGDDDAVDYWSAL